MMTADAALKQQLDREQARVRALIREREGDQGQFLSVSLARVALRLHIRASATNDPTLLRASLRRLEQVK